MLGPAALMTVAIYWKPSVPPSTGLNPPMTIQQTEGQERLTESPVNAQQQREGDGTVRDRNDADRTNTGLLPDPEAGDAIVIPRQK